MLGAAVADKKYDRPANPALSLLGDATTGVIIKFEMLEPEEIRISNIVVESGLEQICNVCGVKLRRVKRLKGLEEVKLSSNSQYLHGYEVQLKSMEKLKIQIN